MTRPPPSPPLFPTPPLSQPPPADAAAHRAQGKPMIISTGMSTPEEIDRTVQVVRAEGTPFALMHCTSTYPTPYEHVQLGCITWLQDLYGVPVGFSDHTLGSFLAFAAAANGANI